MNFAGITVSDAAKEKLKELLAKNPKAIAIRISISSKGCSGQKYVFDYAEKQNAADDLIDLGGVRLLVDPSATLFLFGAELIWVSEKFREGFDFVNKNEAGRCGCGESFSA